jgi:Asp-tRNA(Asn)/Glu-tRNA(Gln) amidotransferase A subunit family amidase
MLEPLSPLTQLRLALTSGESSPASVAEQVLAKANGNVSRNTYLWLDPDNLGRQVDLLDQPGPRPPLWSIPISLKDCFDLAGAPTSCGSRFYEQRGMMAQDSAVAFRLRAAGALITGKTHLHQLAYGITGENSEYGDCRQPRDASLLTGGSSSGAAASVQEGSALAAIGTDTGGSIRVPAALCGLVGFRASREIGGWRRGAWQGAAHLAPSFDTLGFLLRDPRDAAPIAQALFGIPSAQVDPSIRIGCVPDAFLWDCEAEVLTAFRAWKQDLSEQHAAVIEEFDPEGWQDSLEIFAGIQAHEAAGLHAGNFDHFERAIRDRLYWGASLAPEILSKLERGWTDLARKIANLLARFDLLMLPCAPVSRLVAGADHSSARQAILRYTTPFSLAGLPALSLPGELIDAPPGTGIQIAAASGSDPMLLELAGAIGGRLSRA